MSDQPGLPGLGTGIGGSYDPPLSASMAELINWQMRYVIGPRLSGADKSAIADLLGVDVRTVQRWTTTAGTETRNLIPPNLGDFKLSDLPPELRARVNLVMDTTAGATQDRPIVSKREQFTERFGNFADAERYVEALRAGQHDPWLQKQTARMRIVWRGDGWDVEIEYDRGYGS